MRYVNDAFTGPSFIPGCAADRARMDMAMGLYDSYGYAPMARAVGYHRFPAFAGHLTRGDVDAALARLGALFAKLMRIRGDSAFLAGEHPTLADFFAAPACFYLELVEEHVPEEDAPGFGDWWHRVQGLDAYMLAMPDVADWGEHVG